MKLSNLRHSFFLTTICSALLSLLGFGCSDEPCMYGMPTGDFEIKGSVTTEEGKAVADAEIRVTHRDMPSGVFSFTTVATDIEGQYFAKGESYADREVKVVCLPSNPELEADSVIV
ncbi:MAG: radical SAM-associated putative lipoprotein, partial [Muribaculaceae bacterium]|nr:radical SAM-associated putative lipoprotein [Muribaculaceae bacterium]